MDKDLNFQTKQVNEDNPDSYQIFLDNALVAEVKRTGPDRQQIIPMRELNDREENELLAYIHNNS